MKKVDRTSDHMRYTFSLLNIINIRKKILTDEFKESDNLLISQLFSKKSSIDKRLIEYLYIYLYTHKDLLMTSEVRYNSNNKTFTLLSVVSNEEPFGAEIKGKIEQISLTEDAVMPIKKETSYFEKLDDSYKAWKEASFSTAFGIELARLCTEPVTVAGENLSLREVNSILDNKLDQELYYRKIMDLGIIQKVKNGRVTRFYCSPDENIIDIVKDKLENVDDKDVNNKNEDYWKSCKYHLEHEYYGYPKEIRNALSRAVFYQDYVKDKNIVEDTYAYYGHSLKSSVAVSEMNKKNNHQEDKSLDEDINRFMMMMENSGGISFNNHEQKK